VNDLCLRCKPVRVEAVGRPRKIVLHAVEAEAKEMLNRRCSFPGSGLRCVPEALRAAVADRVA
jgi:hypothetical protein